MRSLMTAAVVLCAGACTGTEIGNPARDGDADLTLSAAVSGTQVALANGDAAGARTVVEGAWVVLGDIRFVYDDDCSRDRDTRVTVAGPLVVELLAGSTLPAPLPGDADYCRVRIPLTRAQELEADAPPELLDHSVLLTGRHDGMPLSIRTRGRPELQLRSMDEPFHLDGEGNALLLAFDVAGWLDGIDLDGAEVGDDGRILIDEDHQRGLLNVFDDNLRQALTLYRDLDADGSLGDDERDSPLATPEP